MWSPCKFAVFALLLPTQVARAEKISTASDYFQACAFARFRTCLQAHPDDPKTCSNSDLQNKTTVICDNDVQIFCRNSTTPNHSPTGCRGLPGQQVRQRPGQNAVLDLDQAQADLNDCLNSYKSSQTCCNNPKSCGGNDSTGSLNILENQWSKSAISGDSKSLQKVCDQASQAGNLVAEMKINYAMICSASHNGCSNKCEVNYSTWLARRYACNGTCDIARLKRILAQLNSARQNCDALAKEEAVYQSQADRQASNAGLAEICSRRVTRGRSNPVNPSNDDLISFSNITNLTAQNATPSREPAAVASDAAGLQDCGTIDNIADCVKCAEHPELPSCGDKALRSPSSQLPGTTDTLEDSASDGAERKATMFPHTRKPPPIGSLPALDPSDLSGSLLARAKILSAHAGVKLDIFETLPETPHANATTTVTGSEKTGSFEVTASTGFEATKVTGNVPATDARGEQISPINADMFQSISRRFRIVCERGGYLDCQTGGN